ncbi:MULTISPECIES: DUF2115 domain-containing protein [Dehalobacter]|jgi:Uncharacterized protein conserved in archaea|nr:MULTISPECIES: DUF2115 domain-containing protein [unclassified Dehalobacter]AFV05303.1 UPF0305 protein [Dehalobacter sp. CF]MDJ0305774.1 DUF2115 domain-containing protein [Dehalobacter sp.]
MIKNEREIVKLKMARIMNTQDLFIIIKNEAESLHIENFLNLNKSTNQVFEPGSIEYISNLMSNYNLSNYFEIIRKENVNNPEDINPHLIEDFSNRIEIYMDENAPGQIDLKQYIRIISTYLAFISKKPLHPLGMIMQGTEKIIKQNDKYYCPMRRAQIKGKLSLCIYCVCRDITELKND